MGRAFPRRTRREPSGRDAVRQSAPAFPGARRKITLGGEPVETCRGPGKEIGFLRSRGAAGEPLERVPHHRITAGALVDWEIAFEHAAIGAEILDAGLDVRAPGICH